MCADSCPIRVIDAGTVPYREMLARQHTLFDAMVAERRAGREVSAEYVIMVEHPPVITLGRHADRHNLLVSRDKLALAGYDVVDIDRGGDITYHGPGQLVVYPIIDMQRHRLGVKDYVHLLEQAVIDTIGAYGIRGERVDGATGVWIDAGTPRERKICAIGVRCSHFVTMHGLALNVTTDMRGFTLINPCGFVDKGVTSMALELPDAPPDPAAVRSTLAATLLRLLAR